MIVEKLYCLKCAHESVPVLVFSLEESGGLLTCRDCGANHYLRVLPERSEISYCRYTRRYPPEFYPQDDFSECGISIEQKWKKGQQQDTSPFGENFGLVRVQTRRKFNLKEVSEIWKNSDKKCHLCGKRWKLNQRSRSGWHIDHIIPNIGGGHETEEIENMKVACAKCNLGKGKGFSDRKLKEKLSRIIQYCAGRKNNPFVSG